MIATRSDRRCVTRYGSTTVSPAAARGARRRGGRVAGLAKELHLRRVVAAVEGTEQPPRERVHRGGEDQVEDDRRKETADDVARRCTLAEHEVHDQDAEGIQHRD